MFFLPLLLPLQSLDGKINSFGTEFLGRTFWDFDFKSHIDFHPELNMIFLQVQLSLWGFETLNGNVTFSSGYQFNIEISECESNEDYFSNLCAVCATHVRILFEALARPSSVRIKHEEQRRRSLQLFQRIRSARCVRKLFESFGSDLSFQSVLERIWH